MSVFLIVPDYEKTSQIILNKKTALDLGIQKKKHGCVSFGSQKAFVDFTFSDEIPKERIGLSNNIFEYLYLPDGIEFEVSIRKNEVIIGPLIGLLVSKKDSKLGVNRLKRMNVYVKKYSEINGVIAAFALDGIDMSRRLIEGYYYDPKTNGWKRGMFPYPASIYRTIGLDDEMKNHFLSVIGDRFFNSMYFNKWSMYEWFSTSNNIKKYLPDTVLYSSCSDLWNMLKKHRKIYVKPISGLKGNGVLRMIEKKDGIAVRYRDNGENVDVLIKTDDEFYKFANKMLVTERYIIQKGLELLRHNGGLIDFRCIMQKDQENTWKCFAVFGRLGVKNSVVSNIADGGKVYLCDSILKKAYSDNMEKIKNLKEKINKISRDVCKEIDEFGVHCGVLGLDIGVDVYGDIWLIEINNRDPSPLFALDVKDEQLFYTIKTNPIFYAKALAGFEK